MLKRVGDEIVITEQESTVMASITAILSATRARVRILDGEQTGEEHEIELPHGVLEQS
ncbi:hypothetical protein ACELLULO517_16120 [Acidisoma cellulosilytica]|uniref:Uncharacterized protein n=1 Tax=Acidisoma cellulosilyticum TaxID=2802395 RepID=A0A964E4S1_9PROT|nr:hypothetical protein [Acidisoma cellulosilyticum]MCB8881776.1 hypothetical protein [Acidisoma cellulosilyticum]